MWDESWSQPESYSHHCKSLQDNASRQYEGGKCIVISTHKDLVHECDEVPEKKSEKFTAIASPHFKDDLVYRNEGLKEILFQYNTKDPQDEDKEEASKIWNIIEIPIWWFTLQLILEALAHN